ncbi:YfbM family protein [Streptomyces sp. NPDC093591]|uniref:YfbM family protein n=1 Tax=Streptomyces sp. NPDC093591 TaxID=3366044 RepID=UPI0037FEA112
MGVSISFISATTQELDRAEKDPDWADEYVYQLYDSDNFPAPDRPYGGPDKAWGGLQFLFDEARVGPEFLMDGSMILEDGTLFGWTAEQVESLAGQLRETPWERLAAHYDAERMAKDDVYPNMWKFDPEGELGWLEYAYEELVEFFCAAAERGLGAFMTFSF